MATPSISRTRQNLRVLIAEDGFEFVYTELLHEMEEQYRFLHAFFTKTPPIAVVAMPVPAAEAVVPTTPIAVPIAIPVTPAPKKVVRRGRPPSKVLPTVAAVEAPAAATEPIEAAPVAEPEAAPVTEPVPEPVVATPAVAEPTPAVAATPVKRKTPEFTKERQRALVAAKAAELKAQGIDGRTYLTKENLTKWLGEERLTYQKIAQKVGVPETQVSALAKMYCLSSYANGVVAGAYQSKKDQTK